VHVFGVIQHQNRGLVINLGSTNRLKLHGAMTVLHALTRQEMYG